LVVDAASTRRDPPDLHRQPPGDRRRLPGRRAACAEVRADPSLKQSGSAPMYGMMAKLPLRGMVKQSVKKVMQAMYMPGVVVPDVNASAQDGVVGKLIDRYGSQIDAALDKLAAVRGALGRRR
jgi:hypothetical protein